MSSAAQPRGGSEIVSAPSGSRLLDQLAAGNSIDHIAQARNHTRAKVEKLLRAELQAVSIRPASDFAKIQIRRLDALIGKITPMGENGDLGAVDRLLKIFDRLDRYHGFSKKAAEASLETEVSRERLYAKLTHAARIRPQANAEP